MKDSNQSPIITEFNIVSDEITYQDEFLDDQKYCKLCGGELVYSHVTNFLSGIVEEKSHCNLCNVKNSDTNHKLQ